MKHLIIFISAFFYASAAFATPATKGQIAFAEEYLNGIKSMVSEFIQEAPNGEISTGTFFLSRPGKLRWQYHPPVPVLIIANKGRITYYDAELDETTYVDEEETLASLLTRSNIQFSGDLEVRSATSENKIMRVTLALKDQEDAGSMTLVFEEAPFLLRKIEIHDAAENTTRINLNNPQFGVAVDNKLFTFRAPRKNSRNRK